MSDIIRFFDRLRFSQIPRVLVQKIYFRNHTSDYGKFFWNENRNFPIISRTLTIEYL